MSNFMEVGIFWICLNRADLGCWRLTLRYKSFVNLSRRSMDDTTKGGLTQF